MNAESEEEMTDLCKDDEILNLLSQCGETSVLSVSLIPCEHSNKGLIALHLYRSQNEISDSKVGIKLQKTCSHDIDYKVVLP